MEYIDITIILENIIEICTIKAYFINHVFINGRPKSDQRDSQPPSPAPQNYFVPLSHFFNLKFSVKVRNFLLYELLKKRAQSYSSRGLDTSHMYIVL